MAEIPSSRKYASGGSRQTPTPPTATRSTPSPTATRTAPPSRNSSVQRITPARTATSTPKKQSSGKQWLFVVLVLALLAWWYASKADDLPYRPYPSKQIVNVIPSTYVNVRAGPGVEFPILAEVAPSTTFWGLGETSDTNGDVWIAIETADDGHAYVKGKLLLSGN